MKFITLAACALLLMTQTNAESIQYTSNPDPNSEATSQGRGQLNDRCYVGSSYWNCQYPLTCVADNDGYTAGKCVYQCSKDVDCDLSDDGPFCINHRCTCKDTNTANNDNDNCVHNFNGPVCKYGKCQCQSSTNCIGNSSGKYCKSDYTCGCKSNTDCPVGNKCSSTRGVCYCDDASCGAGKICNFNENVLQPYYDRDAVCKVGQCRQFFTSGLKTCAQLYNNKNSCDFNTLKCHCDQSLCAKGTFCKPGVLNDSCTAQCLVNTDCPNSWQVCNGNNKCVCDNTKCQTNIGHVCTNNNPDGVCQCDTTVCNNFYTTHGNNLGGKCQGTDSGVTCIQKCTDLDQYNSPQCASGSVCVSQGVGGDAFCYPNNIKCIDTHGAPDSLLCPENMHCQGASSNANQNSPYCVPECWVVNNFCEGFQCPAGYKWSLTGTLCVDTAELDGYKVCSCVKPA